MMARSSASLAGGLDHLFNLGQNPLAPFRGTTMDTKEDKNMCQSEDKSDTDDSELNRQAVERELRRYEDDGLSDTTSLVTFWEVRMASFVARMFSANMDSL
jgi:hypothetical protein